MKAIVNIGLRTVELRYSIKPSQVVKLTYEEINQKFKNWATFQKTINSKIVCKHVISFKDADEWQSHILFDGRVIDFHYDYEMRKEFDSKKDWGEYIFQGYEYIEGEPQMYDNNIVKQVIIEL